MWIMGHNGIRWAIHYLNDYLFLGSSGSEECARALSVTISMQTTRGAHLKTKTEEMTLPFLGILLDTSAMELRLPENKLVRLKSTIVEWKQRKSCTKRELLSLIGQLQHACKVVRCGHAFLRRMITLSTSVRELHHHVRLKTSFRSDLEWWAVFLPQWNGVSMMSVPRKAKPGVIIVSDASGNWGCGAYSRVVSVPVARVLGRDPHNY